MRRSGSAQESRSTARLRAAGTGLVEPPRALTNTEIPIEKTCPAVSLFALDQREMVDFCNYSDIDTLGYVEMHSTAPRIAKEIFILDDDADVRETLCTILESGGYNPVCFADETSLLESIRRRCPAGVLLDVNLPGRSGLEILKDLAVYHLPVLMISGQGDVATVVTAIRDGAIDFLQKPFKSKEVLDRLDKMVGSLSLESSTALERRISLKSFPGREPLTRRERDVLQLVATGSSNKHIGETLGISYRTVEEHRSNIMHKLGVKNVAELLIAVLT